MFAGVGTRHIGRYALYGEIASGGVATVHYGRLLGPVGFSRTVAIKRLHSHFARDPEFVTGFLDEARLAARIRHPNVAATVDVVAAEGELFLVMEWIHGESLSALMKQLSQTRERIPPHIVASIASGVLQGLHAAHTATDERGVGLEIVHRDVSPQNILVGADGMARVLDFGIAKATTRLTHTREGRVKGKLPYMPPEQLSDGKLDARADIYAAAVVTWEMLTGRRLFRAETDGGIIASILHDEVKPPSTFAPSIPAALEAAVMRGLERAPANRYSSAQAMALAIEACGPIASAAEVGAWLTNISAATLADRARHVAQIEAGSSLGINVHDALNEITPSQTSREAAVTPPSATEDDTQLETALDTRASAPETRRSRPSRTAALVGVALLVLLGAAGALVSATRNVQTAHSPSRAATVVDTSKPTPSASGELTSFATGSSAVSTSPANSVAVAGTSSDPVPSARVRTKPPPSSGRPTKARGPSAFDNLGGRE
ncbi:serine/threonine protein kinase [Labilithrix luteola]|uniref:Serine/threonine protein kinase n=1 Tax=Labilithrix luteola TaxID=1391654 RepID=A0A0K1PYM4_9BACT|nr:serine/threonine-protein kinase [Labilithrix luteola]AKU98491.1 serine/threonine protein kinase [Labilithrix luteola]